MNRLFKSRYGWVKGQMTVMASNSNAGRSSLGIIAMESDKCDLKDCPLYNDWHHLLTATAQEQFSDSGADVRSEIHYFSNKIDTYMNGLLVHTYKFSLDDVSFGKSISYYRENTKKPHTGAVSHTINVIKMSIDANPNNLLLKHLERHGIYFFMD